MRHKANFFIKALKRGRKIRPHESIGIGQYSQDSTCAAGAIALGLGYDKDQWGTLLVRDFFKEGYPEFPFSELILVNDKAKDGVRDATVRLYLSDALGD